MGTQAAGHKKHTPSSAYGWLDLCSRKQRDPTSELQEGRSGAPRRLSDVTENIHAVAQKEIPDFVEEHIDRLVEIALVASLLDTLPESTY